MAMNSLFEHGLNADLHSHSHYSDGVLAPETLVQRAKNNGLGLLALTDHDEVAGCTKAIEAAHDLFLSFVPGVEISVSFLQETVHIVGLGVDINNPDLLLGLEHIRLGRKERAKEMARCLAKIGIQGAYEGALQYAANPQSLSRTHFARFLIDKGICNTTAAAFNRFLKEGKPGYVPHQWATLGQSVQWIKGAGGIAVIAHPGRYKKLNRMREQYLFESFIELGGQAVEVVTGSHSSMDAVKYTEVAKCYHLWASRGSDFHSPKESRIDLGALPPLDTGLDPVWVHLTPTNVL